MSLTLAEVAAWIIVVALNAYVLFGGADFGGGVWDLLASGARRQRQRDLIASAIAPIWEANHVWLIVAVVMLFVCFPVAFAAFGTILHIPLSLMLIGIVLRGSAFVFRSYSYGPQSEQRRWGQVFAVSSVITPAVLGMCVGAVVSGNVGRAMAEAARGSPASFSAVYVQPWISAFELAVGAMTVAMVSFLAATYLTIEAEGDRELQDDFRSRALGAAVAALALATIALALGSGSGTVLTRLTRPGWATAVLAGSGIAALTSALMLFKRRFRTARLAAGAWVTLVLWGWVLAQFPLIIPPNLTINAAAAPDRTLEETMAVLVGGGLVLIPSLWYLLRVFKRRTPVRAQSTDVR
jgi:cytochrome d ubiquinol oxidase subunit II